jgi:hypothetical protein
MFSTKTGLLSKLLSGYCPKSAGRRAGRPVGQASTFGFRSITLVCFGHTKLGVWIAYIKMQLGNVTQGSVIKVKVTVTKNRNSVSTQ